MTPATPSSQRVEDPAQRRPSPGAITPAVSIVVPTYNERGNLPVLLRRLGATLASLDHEIIVVDDDSPDGTWRLAQRLAIDQPEVRVVRRVGRRGLSSAVVDGMRMATGSCVAVLDADLQHDEAALPRMVDVVLGGRADICVGSRQAAGGSYGEFGYRRRALSRAGAAVARLVLRLDVRDAMSGYFVVSRQRVEEVVPMVDPRGFKVLLELLARGPKPEVVEVGYRFRMRTHGTTKLTGSVLAAFVVALASLSGERWRKAWAHGGG
jgi:dolichol-phosphate mannosyltransferase